MKTTAIENLQTGEFANDPDSVEAYILHVPTVRRSEG
jgi:hypothetical protein